jgi:hypothetical protein
MFILFSNTHDSPRRTAFTARMIELYPKWKERYRDFEVVVVDSTSPVCSASVNSLPTICVADSVLS